MGKTTTDAVRRCFITKAETAIQSSGLLMEVFRQFADTDITFGDVEVVQARVLAAIRATAPAPHIAEFGNAAECWVYWAYHILGKYGFDDREELKTTLLKAAPKRPEDLVAIRTHSLFPRLVSDARLLFGWDLSQLVFDLLESRRDG